MTFDLSVISTLVLPLARAQSNAARTMRSTPLRVLISSCTAISSAVPFLKIPPTLTYGAFGVLAEDHEVDVFDALALERAEPFVEQLDRPEVDVEVELEADAEKDVGGVAHVRDARIAEGADQDRREWRSRNSAIMPVGIETPVSR